MPLGAGDIAIVGFGADAKSFAFVLLANGGGETVFFTDNGWTAAGAFRPGEGILSVTLPAGFPIGTVVTITNVNGTPTASYAGGTLTVTKVSGTLDPSQSGDSHIVYTGTTANPTILYAIDFADSNATFAPDATSTTTSAMPATLTLGTTATAFGPDDGGYVGPLSGTKAQILAAIGNAANWSFSESTAVAYPANFTVSSSGGSPGILSVADVAIVEGNGATTDLTFTVTRPAGSSGAVTVDYAVAAGTATAGTDYTIAAATGTLSFSTGDLSKTVTVGVAGDLAIEPNETLSITLSNPTGGATLGTATATGTITNDDAVGTFSVTAPTFAEGDSGTTAANFTITRTGGTSGSATIGYTITPDDLDNQVRSDDGLVVTGGPAGSVTFLEGETTKTIGFTITGDRTVETDETVPISISTTTPGAVIGTASANATVANDDVAGSVSIANATVNEGAGTVTLTVTRTGGSGDFAVNYATADGTALTGSDYTATSGTLTFTGGDTVRTITVPIVNDTIVESDEAFTVALSGTTAGATITGTAASVTIFDNDTAAIAGSVSVADVAIAEGNSGTTNLVVTLTRTGGTAPFTVDYATADGGRAGSAAAVAGSDYAQTGGTATFGTGVNTITVTIPVLGDTTAELTEEFRLLLSNPTNGASLGTGSALLTITNDDTLPASTRIFTESFDGFTAAGFAPTPTAGQLSSDVWRVTGMSDGANPAYGFSGAANTDFGRGTLSANATGGGVYSPSGAPGIMIQPTGTDFAPGSFVEARIQNLSGAAATAFDVGFDWAYRNNETRGEVLSFAWSTDGTTFTTVSAAGLTVPEAADTNGFTLAPATASLTGLSVADQGYLYLRWTYVSTSGSGSRDEIGIDNVTVSRVGGSALPTVSVADVSVDEAAGTMTFTVTRANVASGAFTVDFSTANGTATAGSDYTAATGTISFAEAQASATVTIPITNDARPEFDETLTLTLGNAQGANIVRGTATGTILNDDGAPIQVAIGNASVIESDSGAATLTYTVTRSGGTGAFDVAYATGGGTATAGSDYVATSGTLNFASGETSKTISVTVNGDTLTEPNETVTVTLSGATNDAVLTSAAGTGTILNDEPTPISAIQGSSYFSPLVAGAGITGYGGAASTTVNATSFTVTVRAVVTAIDATGIKQGFYITEEAADWDASALTSEGIFVMTSTDTAGVGTTVAAAAPGLVVGQIVTVTANVMEYRPFATNAPITVLVNPTITLGAVGQPLPTITLDGAYKIPNALLSGVAPDFTDFNDDPNDSFDATNYAMSFFETIEGMLVTVPDVRVADGFTAAAGGGTNFKVYSTASANAEQLNTRGGYTIAGDPVLSPPDTASSLDNVIAGGKGVTDGDINPDILELDFSDFAVARPTYVTNGQLSMGDRLGDITGIVEWSFSDMKLIPTAVGTYVDTVLSKEVTTIAPDSRALTFATFNVENLGGNAAQTRFDAIATVIANSLGSPAILSIEEIQDNNGATNDGTTDAGTTWGRLVAAVNAATGKVYQWVDQPPVNGAEGGEPGGNIRVGFLYDTGRVQLGNLAADAPIEERRKWVDRLGDNARDAGDLIAYSDNMVSGIATADYTTTRLSLVGQFTFNGNTVFAMANHLPSKGGSGTFWDASAQNVQNGTPANSDWTQRSNIGEDIYTFLNYVQTQNASARILSGGDFNDFYFYRPLETATGYVFADGTARNDGARLVNLALALPEAERYTYTFDGRSQAIDHILADAASAAAATTDVVHINSGFPAGQRISDHDPVLTSINMRSFGETLNGTSAGETIDGGGGDDIIDGKGGTDTLIGGAGNDVFFVDSLDDVVTEIAGEGVDEVRTTIANYVLPANVEKLTFIGTAGTGGGTVSGNSGDNSVGGGTGSDNLDLSQGGNDTVDAGAGDDGIFFGAAFAPGDVVDGGAGGNDQLGLQGNYAGGITLSNANLRNVEVVGLQAGAGNSYVIATDDNLLATGGVLTIYAATLTAGQDLTFNGGAETDGGFRVYAGGGTDTITAGGGNDGVYFGPGTFNPATDRIDGGAGTGDQLALDGSYTTTLDGTSLRNFETIVLLPGTPTDRNSFNLTLADSLVGATQTLTVNGGQTVLAMRVDGASESNGNLVLIGGAAGDTLIGGSGADVLFGGAGGDTLTGGAGADIFRYTAVAQSTSTTYDTITDFTYGTDTINLPGVHDSFTRLTTGTLNSANFDPELQAAMAGRLTIGGTVVFTADAGTLAGATFVVVDANGVDGYQAGSDYVFRIDAAPPAVIPDFIV